MGDDSILSFLAIWNDDDAVAADVNDNGDDDDDDDDGGIGGMICWYVYDCTLLWLSFFGSTVDVVIDDDDGSKDDFKKGLCKLNGGVGRFTNIFWLNEFSIDGEPAKSKSQRVYKGNYKDISYIIYRSYILNIIINKYSNQC